jgi:hypothetical protein
MAFISMTTVVNIGPDFKGFYSKETKKMLFKRNLYMKATGRQEEHRDSSFQAVEGIHKCVHS